MPDPTISVLIPVRNNIRFIRATLDSIFAQTVPPAEVIVVDDASDDGTSDLLAAYPDARLRHVLRTDARNIYSAWNHAVALARGDLLAFMSADDLWLPGKLAAQSAVMLARPELRYTCTWFQGFIDPDYPPLPGHYREMRTDIQTGVLMETTMTRRSLFDEYGGFLEDYEVSADVEWFARLKGRNAPYAIIEAVLTHKRMHDANTASRDPDLTRRELLKALRGAARHRLKTPSAPALTDEAH